MRLKSNKSLLTITLLLFLSIQCKIAVCYKSEIEITPSPIEEPTTKKSGFFSGFKNLFRGSSSSTTTTTISPVAPKWESSTFKNAIIPASGNGPQKPPPLVISPLMPLGPRPDTPPSTPLSGNSQQAPQWPQTPSSTANAPANGRPLPLQPAKPNAPLPNFPAVFGGQPLPAKSKQPISGIDLSYGGAAGARNPSSTSSTTSTRKPEHPPMNFDLRGGFSTPATSIATTNKPQHIKQDFPPLPPPRKSSLGVKEDFPALPTPKTPTLVVSTSTPKNNLPSAWNSPNIPNSEKFVPAHVITTPSTTTTTTGGNHGVSFVTHKSTTVRPGFENTGNNLATDNEIMDVTENLFTKENSLLNHIRVNEQGKTRSIDSTDAAPQPLLEVNSQNLNSNTVEKMRVLFNNYEADTATNEHVTPNERKEENEFLDAIMTTPIMRQTMLFLQNKGIVTPDPKTHRDLVRELWFTQYSRGGGKIGSSGFEHVFTHEVKNGTIIGFHNWVYFAEEEEAGRMDYKGYLKEIDLGTKAKVIKMRFSHNNINKPVNGMFIGTSPELELALYTLCFKLRPDRTCPVSLGNTKFGVVTYSWRYRGKSLIGSAFPEI